jgi:hypothetical protein
VVGEHPNDRILNPAWPPCPMSLARDRSWRRITGAQSSQLLSQTTQRPL